MINKNVDNNFNVEDTRLNQGVLEAGCYFPSPVFSVQKPEFLQKARQVGVEYLNKAKQAQPNPNPLYPVHMTDNFYHDDRLKDMVDYVGNTGWEILTMMGYNMDSLRIKIQEFWLQDHNMNSSMGEHVHPYGAQISGFYFIDCPENSSNVIFHDPRPGKKQIHLPEIDHTQVTLGSCAINLSPQPGVFIFVPSWLPHSFSRHGSNESFRFIHFNLVVVPAEQEKCESPKVEII